MRTGRVSSFPRSGTVLLFGLVLSVSACVQTGGAPKGDSVAGMRQHSVARMRASAAELESRDDLYAAREQWRLVRVLVPADPVVDQNIQRLGIEIEAQVAAHLQRGRNARRKGQGRRAKREFLTALALDTTSSQAADQLRAMERKRLGRALQARVERIREEAEALAGQGKGEAEARYYLRQQALQSGQEVRASPGPAVGGRPTKPSLKTGQDEPQGPEQQARRYMDSARTFNSKGDPEAALKQLNLAAALLPPSASASGPLARMLTQTKAVLAERYYARGLRVYAEDPPSAIAYWRKVLEYQPAHRKAGLRLRNALAAHPDLQ